MPTKSPVNFPLLLLMLLFATVFADGIAGEKSELDKVEMQFSEQGVEVPDLLGPVHVWTTGETTLDSLMEDPRLRELYLTASTDHDTPFAVLVGCLIICLVWTAPHTAWPQRMQTWPKIIEGAPLIGFAVGAADILENHFTFVYLAYAEPGNSLTFFQTASTIKWLLIGTSFTLIVGLYIRWVQQAVRYMRNRATA